MENFLLGFVLGVIAMAGFTAGLVWEEGYIDLQSGTMYQQIPGGLLNINTGQFQPIAPLGLAPGRHNPVTASGSPVKGASKLCPSL